MFFFILLLIPNILNEISIKSVISYSSIFHTLMMIFILKIGVFLFFIYIILYIMIIIPLRLFFKYYKVDFIIDLFNQFFNDNIKGLLIILLISLCILPPIYRFMLK